MKGGVGIVWFTNDLRLADNEVLIQCTERHDEVVPVFVLDIEQYRSEQFGFRRMGSRRLKFLLESLTDLQRSMKERGAHLQVMVGRPSEVLSDAVKRYGAKVIYVKKEVGFEEILTQEEVMHAAWKHGAELTAISTSTLYHPQDLPFGVRDVPNVFTEFRKRVERETRIRAALPSPEGVVTPVLNPTSIPTLEDLGFAEPIHDSRSVVPFVGGEQSALNRLHYYFYESQLVSTYKETRNGLLGVDYSSKFSPWLALGCISPRTIYWELKRYEMSHGANDSTYWLVFELLWRDYFRFAMKKYKQKFFLLGGIQDKPVSSEHDSKVMQQWAEGSTGVAFVDANMRELRLTGFMSNRGRQNVASYFCNDLAQDWRRGAAYFEEQLLDYDVSSNWCNWAYLAGVGNDPRGNRYFDVEKQARQYDPGGEYCKLWL
jgi:deoxyribodipyrimidine photo-lyase